MKLALLDRLAVSAAWKVLSREARQLRGAVSEVTAGHVRA